MTIFDSTCQDRHYFSRTGLIAQPVATIKGLLLSPSRFFQDLMEGKVNSSAVICLIFYCFMYVIGESFFIREERWLLFAVLFLNAFTTPFILAFAIYLVSMLFCGKKFTYERIFMITAYSSVTLLVAWIPVISWLAGIWRFYLIGLGMTRVGNISGIKAIAILAFSIAILVFLLQILRPVIGI